MPDALEPHRQAEITEVVDRISSFQPTKVAVEVIVDLDAKLNDEYAHYVGPFWLRWWY
jgi:hypothetical protein